MPSTAIAIAAAPPARPAEPASQPGAVGPATAVGPGATFAWAWPPRATEIATAHHCAFLAPGHQAASWALAVPPDSKEISTDTATAAAGGCQPATRAVSVQAPSAAAWVFASRSASTNVCTSPSRLGVSVVVGCSTVAGAEAGAMAPAPAAAPGRPEDAWAVAMPWPVMLIDVAPPVAPLVPVPVLLEAAPGFAVAMASPSTASAMATEQRHEAGSSGATGPLVAPTTWPRKWEMAARIGVTSGTA
jgi:hypothetical protein